jgi:hypothetical protein
MEETSYTRTSLQLHINSCGWIGSGRSARATMGRKMDHISTEFQSLDAYATNNLGKRGKLKELLRENG